MDIVLSAVQFNTGTPVFPSSPSSETMVCFSRHGGCRQITIRMCAAHLFDVAERLGRQFELDRSSKDKRLMAAANSVAQEGTLILSLPFEDSDSTGPFCNGLTCLENKVVNHLTLSEVAEKGFTLRATDKTPWTAKEDQIMQKVILSFTTADPLPTSTDSVIV
jgi:hypothetical protein